MSNQQRKKFSGQKSTESAKPKQVSSNLGNKSNESLDSVQEHYNRNIWHVTNTAAAKKIDLRNKHLEKIGHDIWLNPSADRKNESHNYLCDLLLKQGCAVKRNYILRTGFKAIFSSDTQPEQSVPVVGLICQYDSHNTCGHNLSTEATIGAFMGIRAAMQSDTRLKGKLIILGTPASEITGGKIQMLSSGAFDGIDVVMAVHPSNTNVLMPKFHALQKVLIYFEGNSCHIDCMKKYPDSNAKDAAYICYNNCLTQSNRLTNNYQMHCTVTNTGDDLFTIPGITQLTVLLRAPTLLTLEPLYDKLINCVMAAATVTACKYRIDFTGGLYACFLHNQVLANAFKEEAAKVDMEYKQHDDHFSDHLMFKSTDFGNVSLKIPVLYPSYSIRTAANRHTKEFAAAADTAESQSQTLKAATALAFTVIKYFLSPNLQQEIQKQFQNDKNKLDYIMKSENNNQTTESK